MAHLFIMWAIMDNILDLNRASCSLVFYAKTSSVSSKMAINKEVKCFIAFNFIL